MEFDSRPCYIEIQQLYRLNVVTMFILFLDDGNSPERVCAIAGSPDKVQIAAQMIQELLNDYNVCDFFNFQILFLLIGLLGFF